MTECDRIVADASPPLLKAKASLVLSEASLEFGSAGGAMMALNAARNLLSRDITISDPARAVFLESRLTEYRIVTALGREKEAESLINALLKDVQPIKPVEPFYELLLEAHLEFGRFCIYSGRLDEGRTALTRACDLMPYNQSLAQRYAAQLAFIRAYLYVESSVHSSERTLKLNEALEAAITCGSSQWALAALILLGRHYSHLSQDDHAQAFVERALEVARGMEGTWALAMASVDGAFCLLNTKYWRASEPLLYGIESSVQPGTAWWASLKRQQGKLLSKLGSYSTALDALSDAENTARAIKMDGLLSSIISERALVLKRRSNPSRSQRVCPAKARESDCQGPR
jgi:tetratricopeptide (TPR) repeat protein